MAGTWPLAPPSPPPPFARSLRPFPSIYCSGPGVSKQDCQGGLRYLIFWSRKSARLRTRGEACPRAADRPLLINFGSDRPARTRMTLDKEARGRAETERRKKKWQQLAARPESVDNASRIRGWGAPLAAAVADASRSTRARDHPHAERALRCNRCGGRAKGERSY